MFCHDFSLTMKIFFLEWSHFEGLQISRVRVPEISHLGSLLFDQMNVGLDAADFDKNFRSSSTRSSSC
jgi:hypothetical protein